MQARYNRDQDQVTNEQKGYAPVAMFALMSDFQTIAEPPGSPTNLEDKVTITDDHVFVTASPQPGFTKLYSLPKDNQMNGSSPGDDGAKNGRWTHTLFLPGDDAKTQAMIESVKNKQIMLLVEDANSTDAEELWWQYGSKRLPAYISDAVPSSGNINGEGVRGWKLDISSSCRYQYNGARTLQA